MKKSSMKVYGTLLERTKVPLNMPVDEQIKISETLNKFIIDNIPAQLYRFRQCSELNFDAFNNKLIWTSRGIDMNDDYDARIYYNKRKVTSWFNNYFDADNSLKILNSIMRGMPIPQDYIKLPLTHQFIDSIRKSNKEQVILGSIKFKDFFNEYFPKYLDGIVVKICQRTVKYACFCENIGSVAMWGQYAANGTGFALAYDFQNNTLSDCVNCNKRGGIGCSKLSPKCHIMPILYSNKRLDATEFAISLALRSFLQDVSIKCTGQIIDQKQLDKFVPIMDSYMVSKIAIHKSVEWSNEKEWRLFYTDDNLQYNLEEHSSIKKSPTALYLGRHIKPYNEKLLIMIANEQKIPVYKMVLPNNSRKYELIAKRIC